MSAFFYNNGGKGGKKPSRMTILLSTAAILLLCAAAVWAIVYCSERMVDASAQPGPPTLVIDAGHGGFDGGAVSADGTKEIRDVVDVGATLDEIIADGFYFAKSLKLLKYIFANPEILDRPISLASGFDYK